VDSIKRREREREKKLGAILLERVIHISQISGPERGDVKGE
jgi:hypothetical protein